MTLFCGGDWELGFFLTLRKMAVIVREITHKKVRTKHVQKLRANTQLMASKQVS